MFFDNFDRYCKMVGKSNSEVTKAIGLDPSSCSGWKKGAVPRNGTLQKLADYFGVTIEDLIGEKEKLVHADERDEEMRELFRQWKTLPDAERETSKAYFKGVLDAMKKGGSNGKD